MTIEELRKICNEAASRIGGAAILVLPGKAGRGATRRLFGRRGPRGEVLAENNDGNTVCRFDPKAILRFLDNKE